MTQASSAPAALLTIDVAIDAGDWPPQDELEALCRAAIDAALAETRLKTPQGGTDLSLLFTSDAEIQRLNAEWRGQDKPTNVLSFPAFPPDRSAPLPPLLGDIVLAAETVEREAAAEGKRRADHITHLVVHGFLHLVGLDHETDAEAEEMETLERRILARLAIADPYA